MFIYSAKMDKKKLAAVLICIAVAVLVLVFVLTRNACGSNGTEDTSRTEQLRLLKSSKVESNEDRLYLLTALGWEVNIQPAESIEVRIPAEFTDIYTRYNTLQKEQGFDLSKYKGDKVMRYTYIIVNHPSGEENVRATLLVYKNKLIGGDICSLRMNGFMHTLLMPEEGTVFNEAETAQTSEPEGEGASVVTDEFTPVNYNDGAIFPAD